MGNLSLTRAHLLQEARALQHHRNPTGAVIDRQAQGFRKTEPVQDP